MGLRAFFALVQKDIKIEFRGKQLLISSLAFGVLLLFIMGMALDAASHLPIEWSSGVLWLCLFFSVAISVNRHDLKDREYAALSGIVLAPVDRSLVFYAKWVSTFAVVGISSIALIIAFFVILNVALPQHLLAFVGVAAGGVWILVGVATFLAVLTAQSSMRDILLPLILFPITIPLFLALIRLTMSSFAPSLYPEWQIWAEVLVGYFAVFVVTPWLLFEPLLEV